MAGGQIEIEVVPDLRRFPQDLRSGLERTRSAAGAVARGIGVAITAGVVGAGVAFRSIISLGNELTSNLNTLQAVSQATGEQMESVRARAEELGSDLTLPATSAADAAAAMLELARGGLTVEEAMEAARGTIQLAAAAQVDAATAAEIQAAALSQFQLDASEASRVADVLANSANASAGSITDMAYALRYVGPVAQSLGISIEDTAAAIAQLSNAGFSGETAGTALRGILVSLAAPSNEAAGAIETLGLTAFDAEGRFVGFQEVIGQLADAQARLTDEQFAGAAATAFGREPLAAVNALATEGAASFDAMAEAVGRQGGAAEVAAAQMLGLPGAMEQFASQAESAGLRIYDAIDEPLEALVRSAAQRMEPLGESIAEGIETGLLVAETFGPQLADALSERGDAVEDALDRLLGPIADQIGPLLNEALNIGITAWDGFTEVAGAAVDELEPLAQATGELVGALTESGAPLTAFGAGLGLAADAATVTVTALGPIVDIAASLVAGFAALPGPVQSAVAAMLLLRLVRPQVDGLASSVRDRLSTAYTRLQEEMRLQQSLAAMERASLRDSATGFASVRDQIDATTGVARVHNQVQRESYDSIGAIGSQVPAIGRMATAYTAARDGAAVWLGRQQQLVAESDRLTGSLRQGLTPAVQAVGSQAAGVAAGGLSLLRTGVGGLVSALGGPWGLAIGAAAIGLGMLADSQRQAAQAAEEHRARIETLASTLDQQTGAVTRATREMLAAEVAETGLDDAARSLGLSSSMVTEAMLGNEAAIARVNSAIRSQADATSEADERYGSWVRGVEQYGGTWEQLREAALGNVDAYDQIMSLVNGPVNTSAMQGLIDNVRSGIGPAHELAAALGSTRSELDQAADRVRESATAMGENTSSSRELESAIEALGSAASTSEQRIDALGTALDALSGGQRDFDESLADLEAALGNVGTASRSLGESLEESGGALLNQAGRLDVTTEAGRRFQDSVFRSRDALLTHTTVAYEDIAAREGQAAAAEYLTGQVDRTRETLIGEMVQLGATRDQAEQYIDTLSLTPEMVLTAIEQPGMLDSLARTSDLRQRLADLPEGEFVRIDVPTEQQRNDLIDLGYRVRTLPDGSIEVFANTGPADGSIADLIRRNDGRTITLTVATVGIGPGGVPTYSYPSGPGRTQARGGILGTYGAPMSSSVAEIVPPNTWRIVGDRMHGDESFIPINSSARSAAILAETASRMGYQILRRYATGGIASTGGASRLPDPVPAGPSQLVGSLYLDSGEFLGVVRGEIQSSNRATGSAIARRRRV
ncbi:phage tail tape measure protein [Actinoalloteichus sp. GBA129-24]|uniref:phage tail tape measure protein n=1 Tax=Actinoalloteichus sp. GBA129-24 TaxID=1612551 RepID=UPI000950842B|nr:phage tail tape measure protein [Actinoalloteichus sp. GBA129-24]APU20953.1 phage tail tape measure protein, TP901 family [Actinoalloteichus sp. GBA129-24]APU24202.1 phage tail tape measure protein, TP901 family [Actinoalloteichus sp. GBA129-24]